VLVAACVRHLVPLGERLGLGLLREDRPDHGRDRGTLLGRGVGQEVTVPMDPAALKAGVEDAPGGGPEALVIVGDAKLLFQVFSNLLANAVKYSPNGGAILVEAGVSAGEAIASVSDRGIGIPAPDLSRLFERYYRGGNVSGIVGTGVGLYLVKTAVDMHKGRVEVASPEGGGSRFVVRLPLVPAARESQTNAEPRTAHDAPSIVISSDSMT